MREKKFIKILNETHILFKNYIKKYRKEINIDEVNSGEYWYGKQILEKKIIDEIKTSDEYIMKNLIDHNTFIVNQNKKYTYENKFKTLILNMLHL